MDVWQDKHDGTIRYLTCGNKHIQIIHRQTIVRRDDDIEDACACDERGWINLCEIQRAVVVHGGGRSSGGGKWDDVSEGKGMWGEAMGEGKLCWRW